MERRLSTDVDGLDSLAELALEAFVVDHATDQVWRQLDPVLCELTRNPWGVLQTVSREILQHVLADPAFRKSVDDLVQAKRHAAEASAWFQQIYPQSPLSCVAYFSMEFMLSEALPIYSGGLGNVAGDQLKAASNLGVPVIGVGLLYQQGYFRQVIDEDGAQQALFPYNDPGQLPIAPLGHPNGEWLRLLHRSDAFRRRGPEGFRYKTGSGYGYSNYEYGTDAIAYCSQRFKSYDPSPEPISAMMAFAILAHEGRGGCLMHQIMNRNRFA